MSTEELNHLPDSDTAFHQYFYRLWCAKEALYKALPASTQKKAALASLSYTDLKKERTEWHLCETQIASYRIAIVTQKALSMSELPLIELNLPYA